MAHTARWQISVFGCWRTEINNDQDQDKTHHTRHPDSLAGHRLRSAQRFGTNTSGDYENISNEEALKIFLELTLIVQGSEDEDLQDQFAGMLEYPSDSQAVMSFLVYLVDSLIEDME